MLTTFLLIASVLAGLYLTAVGYELVRVANFRYISFLEDQPDKYPGWVLLITGVIFLFIPVVAWIAK